MSNNCCGEEKICSVSLCSIESITLKKDRWVTGEIHTAKGNVFVVSTDLTSKDTRC